MPALIGAASNSTRSSSTHTKTYVLAKEFQATTLEQLEKLALNVHFERSG